MHTIFFLDSYVIHLEPILERQYGILEERLLYFMPLWSNLRLKRNNMRFKNPPLFLKEGYFPIFLAAYEYGVEDTFQFLRLLGIHTIFGIFIM